MFEVPVVIIVFGSVMLVKGLQKVHKISYALYDEYMIRKKYEKLSPECGKDTEFDQEMCVICLEEFDDKEKFRKLPCKHIFHKKCIDHWVMYSKTACPICNDEIFNSLK